MADGRKGPNRPIRPRGGSGGRKRRVVIEGGGGRSQGRQARDRSSAPPQPRQAPAPPPTGPVTVESGVTVKDLSHALGVPMPELIKILMGLGQMRTATQSLSDEEVETIGSGARPRDHDQACRRGGARAGVVRRQRRGPRSPTAGRDDHGSRRPRQDDAPRRHSRGRGRRDRGRRDHAAHRCVPGRGRRTAHHLPRHARPRGVHGHARARREGDRHRRARRRSRRRRHAADEGVDLTRSRRRGADRRCSQQDGRARRERRPREVGARGGGSPARGLGRYDTVLRGLREAEGQHRRPAREDPPRRGRGARSAREPGRRGIRRRRRVAP